MDKICERIRQRRKELGMTQEDLADMVGYKSRSMIHRIETGKQDIPRAQVSVLAAALKTTPAWLLDLDTNQKEQQRIENIILARPELRTLFNICSKLPAGEIEKLIKILRTIKRNK